MLKQGWQLGLYSNFAANFSYLADWEPLENILLAQDRRKRVGETGLAGLFFFTKVEAGLVHG